jgi:asparagine synthase (glutamine-hydrolysing)
MCGIFGIAKSDGRLDQSLLEGSVSSLAHRGPDAAGNHVMRGSFGAVGFGHTRLAILDLSDAGVQPMIFRNLMITYNGEIYNYRELRSELEKKGYAFDSDTDTEVVLKAFHLWGVECVQRFRGMFAFSIFDENRECIYLVRDRVGVKPLYYSMLDQGLVFSSEMRPLYDHAEVSQEIDRKAMYAYFQYGYVPRDKSILKSCSKLLPGHYAVYSLKDSTITNHRYWSVSDLYKPDTSITYSDALESLHNVMRESFRYRLVSDVPVGLFLSGGFDSACLASVLTETATNIKAFTMGFDDPKYDETSTAQDVAQHLGLEHVKYRCTMNEARDLIPELCEIYDEPFGDASALPTVLLSRLVSREVKVALSADGGDELFAGYTRYQKMMKHWGNISRYSAYIKAVKPVISGLHDCMPIASLKQRLSRLKKYSMMASSSDIDSAYLEYVKRFDDRELSCFARDIEEWSPLFLCDRNQGISDLSKMQLLDCQTYMIDDVLVKVDRATMSNSLEAREPFLDHKLIELAAMLPDSMKLQGGLGKRIVRDIVYKRIPREIIDKPKKGFGIPILDWLRTDLREILTDTLSAQSLQNAGLYDVDLVSREIARYLNGDKGNFEWIWFLFMFELWRQRWTN